MSLYGQGTWSSPAQHSFFLSTLPPPALCNHDLLCELLSRDAPWDRTPACSAAELMAVSQFMVF